MKVGPSLVVRATIVGCILLASFGIFVSAKAKPLTNAPAATPVVTTEAQPSAPSGATLNKDQSNSTLANAVQATAQPAKITKAQKKSKTQTACDIGASFPDAIQQWCSLITQYANLRSIPPNLVAAVMLQESGGDPTAYSASGAVGLLQVMPNNGLAAYFMCGDQPCFANRPSIAELEDPQYNIEYGTAMLANLLEKYGNWRDALKAYGPINMGYAYADKVLAIYQNYGGG